MSISEKIENTFNENNIKYFRGNDANSNIYSLIYRGIKNQNYHILIYMEIDEKLKMIKFITSEKANKQKNIMNIKNELLDLNSALNFGNLSMRNDSDTVEYQVDYQLNEEDFSYKDYMLFIIRCINVYEELKNREII